MAGQQVCGSANVQERECYVETTSQSGPLVDTSSTSVLEVLSFWVNSRHWRVFFYCTKDGGTKLAKRTSKQMYFRYQIELRNHMEDSWAEYW
jgi:hypothetical protein